jgi:hypothetical protein
MHKASEPALAKLLQDAIDRGQVVVIPGLLPLLREKDEALVATSCLRFGLTHAEGRAFVQLMEHEHVSREALHVATSPDGKSAIKIVDVIVCKLRRKLEPHGIGIVTVYGQGFRLDKNARDKTRRLLAEYDAGLIPTTPSAEPQADQSELSM